MKKIVIELPNKTYNMIKSDKYDYGDMNIIIKNGIPLEDIKAEIIEMRSRQNVGVLECLDIIDKHISGKDK